MVEKNRDTTSGQYADVFGDKDFIEVVAAEGIASTQEIADQVGCAYRTAYDRLHELEEDARLIKEQYGGNLVWRVESESESESESDIDENNTMPTVEDGLNPDAVSEDYVGDE